MDDKKLIKLWLLVLEILLRLDTKLDEALKIAANINNDDQSNKWLNNEQVKKFLGVSTRTLQKYRDQGILAFSQKGRKIYYLKADIEKYMNDHRIKF